MLPISDVRRLGTRVCTEYAPCIQHGHRNISSFELFGEAGRLEREDQRLPLPVEGVGGPERRRALAHPLATPLGDTR